MNDREEETQSADSLHRVQPQIPLPAGQSGPFFEQTRETNGPRSLRGLEEKKRILRERAKQLAQEPESNHVGCEYLEVVEFSLAHETYAMESAFVREVYPLKDLTPVPCTPPFVLGIINVRGLILSIIDMRELFDLPKKGITDRTKVIIVGNENMEFGILADHVLHVEKIPVHEIRAELVTGTRENYLKGVTKQHVVILDSERLLSDDRIVVHEEPAG